MATSSGSGDYSAVVQALDANDQAIIATGHTVTLDGNVTGCNYFSIQAGATLVGAGYSITVDNDSSDWSFFSDGTISAASATNLIITNPNGVSKLNWNGQGGGITNLTINHADCVATLEDENQTLLGNLTITAGALTTLDTDGSTSRDLTVTGDVEIENGGTLTGNGSAISMGSLATGLAGAGGTYSATTATTTITKFNSSTKAIYGNGPIIHNGGTFAFTNAENNAGIAIQLEGGAGSAGTQFNDITFSGDSTYRFPYYGNDITVSGDITMSGTPDVKQWRRNIIVTGDVDVGSGCVWDCEGSGVADVSSNFTGGSLTIASGGTFKASSGTTTLTSTSSNYSINNAGTFTHNNGTVKIDFETPNYNANSKIKLNQMYNLEVEMNRTTDMTLLEPESSTTLTALNNVTVKKGVLTKNSHTHTLDFKGLTVVGVGGGSLAAHIDASTSGSATSNFGSLTILTDGKYTQSTTTNVSSIRNVGGTIA